jgi:hypothetical protein
MAKYQSVPELLRDRGVEIYREPADPGYDTETKGLLIADYQAYISEKAKPEKPYAVLDHDVALYLAVQRERHEADSALDCGALIVTNDSSLYGFDYRRCGRAAVSTVTLPAQLLQVLRPFGVPSPDFDERFVETFALVEFRTAHNDYAETASKVLGYLASCETLSPVTAAKIMGDQLLLSELNGLDEGSPQFRAIIEAAFVKENARLLEERGNLEELLQQERAGRAGDIAELGQAIAARDGQIVDLGVRADGLRQELDAVWERDRTRTAERAADQGHKADSEQLLTRAFAVGAVAFVLLGAVIFGPDSLHLKWILDLHARRQLQFFTCTVVVSLAWSFVYPKHARWVFGVFMLAIVPQIIWSL